MYAGMSEVGADDLRMAHKVHPVTAVQTEWCLWTRNVEVSPLAVLQPSHVTSGILGITADTSGLQSMNLCLVNRIAPIN